MGFPARFYLEFGIPEKQCFVNLPSALAMAARVCLSLRCSPGRPFGFVGGQLLHWPASIRLFCTI